MLTDKIRLSGPDCNEPEDILSSSLGVIFPDDITNQHGDLENAVIYLSPGFGSITLSVAEYVSLLCSSVSIFGFGMSR